MILDEITCVLFHVDRNYMNLGEWDVMVVVVVGKYIL